MLKNNLLYVFAFVAMIFAACEDEEKLQDAENEIISTYLTQNNITVSPTESGLYFVPKTTQNTNIQAVSGKRAYIHYNAYNMKTGKLFDSTFGRVAANFVVGNNEVIKGLDEGVSMMFVSDTAMLIMPSKLAYDNTKVGQIEPYTPLLFEVLLINVE